MEGCTAAREGRGDTPPMEIHVLDAMAREGFEQIIALHDRRSGLRAFLGLHDTSAGPAFGGIRRWHYRDEREALRDCLRLAAAMSHKTALADLPAGGGKLVALDLPGVDWEQGYAYLGREVERLGGRFYTGPDVGTGERELAWMARETGYVTRPDENGPGELPESTAVGVFAGMGTALRLLDGEEDWAQRRVVVQGLGEVGERLAKHLVRVGATVIASDIDMDRAERVAEELGIELVDPSHELDVECDVFSPCAMGGIVHDLSLARLRCRVVAGAANNILARPEHGDRLHERGILFVPDFIVNAGALIRGAIFHLEGRREAVGRIGERVANATLAVLDRAVQEGLPPARVAALEAEDRLSARRSEKE
jgi:leucine dehydrogenase